jgi:nitrate/nitrite transporter NarK
LIRQDFPLWHRACIASLAMKKEVAFFKAECRSTLRSGLLSLCNFAKDAPQQGKRSESEFLSLLTERGAYVVSLFYGVTFGGFVGLANSIWSILATLRLIWTESRAKRLRNR